MSKWGDFEENEANAITDENGNPLKPYETPVNSKGIKTVVDYQIKPDGTKVKISKKVKVTTKKIRVNKNVKRRKNLRKFGDCKNFSEGPQEGTTATGDPHNFEFVGAQDEEEKSEAQSASLDIVCRNCGGNHWTVRCPKPSVSVDRESSSSGKYVPPKYKYKRQDDNCTLRVTNLSDQVTDTQLYNLFSKFGGIARIFLAKDKRTGLSKGFAFVTYFGKENAERAMKSLQREAIDHLVIQLEWAKPAKESR